MSNMIVPSLRPSKIFQTFHWVDFHFFLLALFLIIVLEFIPSSVNLSYFVPYVYNLHCRWQYIICTGICHFCNIAKSLSKTKNYLLCEPKKTFFFGNLIIICNLFICEEIWHLDLGRKKGKKQDRKLKEKERLFYTGKAMWVKWTPCPSTWLSFFYLPSVFSI